jgi:SPX domain protein involved in polyphosphate accumulation
MSILTDDNYRYELKFLLTPKKAEILKYRLSFVMNKDINSVNKNGEYYIRSLYFDDIYNSSYYDKINGIEKRYKYRIRYYNFDTSYIIIELKGKDGNLGYKKQNRITIQECYDIIKKKYDNINISDDREVLKSFIMEAKSKNLVPSVIVDYKRVAFSYPYNDVRITFDSNVMSGKFNTDFFNKNIMLYNVLEDNTVVFEVKYNDYLPRMVKELIQGIPMTRISMSKFVLCREKKGDV